MRLPAFYQPMLAYFTPHSSLAAFRNIPDLVNAPSPNADGSERAGTALFAVSVRSTARVGRPYRHVAIFACSFSPALLQFYSERHAMTSRSVRQQATFRGVPLRRTGQH